MIFMCFTNVLNKPLLNGYFSREGTMCILVHSNKIGRSDSAKVYDYIRGKGYMFRLREGTGLSM